jgi:farnesyl diphosphate synthase
MTSFQSVLAQTATHVETALNELLPEPAGPEARVFAAMRYAIMAGGKRLRPFFVLQSARLFDVENEYALRVAAAVECVHTYSLVHDDLPCMDDDDLRRGQPTTHKKFDEATAVLAGDALFTFAFEILADEGTHPQAQIRTDLIGALALASGGQGMVGGQMIDLEAERNTGGFDIGAITRLQQLKTGALITFSCVAGAILGRASHERHYALHSYAHDLGLAFQIADDLLDIEGDEAALGKGVRKDAQAGKATFVSVLGVEGARKQAKMLSEQAVQHLVGFDERADLLREAAHFVVSRRT